MRDFAEFDVAIIGAGASGCYLASLLPVKLKTALIDSNDRVGKKLSLTGNGQGNISNANMDVSHYFSVGSKPEKLIEEIISADVIRPLGILTDTDDRGRIYPNSRQASSVTDILRYGLEGIELFLGVKVTEIKKGYEISLSDGRKIKAKKVVLATGGKAQERLGSDGSGFMLASLLGHSVTKLYPGLVQLKTETKNIKTLKGKRVLVNVKAYKGKKLLSSKYGDLIFTEYGVTGDSIFGVSPYVTVENDVTLYADFFPKATEELVADILSNKPAGQEMFTGLLNNQLGRMLYQTASDKSPKGLAAYSKRFPLRVTGNLGFDNAQISVGGIPMDEVTHSLESKLSPGLYFMGEILDVNGECGGYNLHWAFASALRVSEALLDGKN